MSAPEFATLTTDDLVTGEAVALDLPPASLGVRIGVRADRRGRHAGCCSSVICVLFLASPPLPTPTARCAHVALVGTLIVVFLVFPTTVETLTPRQVARQAGRSACASVRDDAGPITFQHAFVRALVGVVEIYAVLRRRRRSSAALLSSRGKRLGDYAAGTYVVRDRVRLRLAAAAADAAAARGVGARRPTSPSLPTGLALAVRQFLGRLPQLDPASRAAIGARLADAGQRRTSRPPPPPGTPPEAFLAAVIATRRERDQARLDREAELRRRLTARR